MNEKNPLVASGEYVRVYVSELMPGEINAFDQIVRKVVRVGDDYVTIFFTDNTHVMFGNLNSTILIRTDSLKD